MEISWFNDYDLHAKVPKFQPQSLTIALNSEFTGGIKALKRKSDQATYRADAQYFAAALFPHRRDYMM